MITNLVTLHDLPIGKSAIVRDISSESIIKRRMMDLGLVPGTRVEAVRVSPVGDPKAFNIRGAVIAFRQEESSQILIEVKGD